MKQVNVGSIDTVILCGGKGTRLKSIVPDKPKILVDIWGLPFIEYLLKYLESEEIKRVILCTGYKHDQIEKWVRSTYKGNLKVLLSREKKPLGTGGALRHAQHLIESNKFFLINGDTFFQLKYSHLAAVLLDNCAFGVLSLTKRTDTGSYGVVVIDSDDRVLKYSEKSESVFGKMSLVNGGVYVFKKEILDDIPSFKEVSFEYDLLPLVIKKYKGSVYGAYYNELFIDIGTPFGYYKAQNIFKEHMHQT